MTDPFYRKIMAPSGNIVSGAAAFMVHIKNAGGPSKMMRDIAIMAGEAGGQKVLDRLSQRHQHALPVHAQPRAEEKLH